MTIQDSAHQLSGFQVTLQRGQGGVAKTGVLTVDDENIVFKGAGGLARLSGVGTVRRSRLDLERVELLGEGGPVELHFGAEQWTLRGDEVLVLADLLAPSVAQPIQTLVEGLVSVRVGERAPQLGAICLTNQRLIFRAGGAEVDEIDVEWAAVSDGHLKGLRPAFYCTIAGVEVRVDGNLAVDLATSLTALRHVESAEDRAESADYGLERWPACRRHGALAIQGELVVGRHHLEFVPSGLMERTLGLKGVVVPYKRLLRAVVHGLNDKKKKFTVVTREARETFTVDHVEDRFDRFVEQFHEGHHAFMESPHRHRHAVSKVLDRWSNALPIDPTRVIEAQPVIQKVGRYDVSVGVLVQTADEVRFYPAGGPKGPTCAEAHPVPRILRRYGGLTADSPVIAFDEGNRIFSYLPAAGVSFTRRFWDRCRAPSRIVHLDMPARRTIERVMGPAHFRQVRTSDGSVLKVEQMIQEGMAWICTFPHGATAPEVGRQVSVDIGQPDGVYRFETQVMDVVRDEDGGRLLLTRPRIIRVYNQRRTYRVPVDISARAQVRPESMQDAPMLAEDSLLGADTLRAAAVVGTPLHLSDLSLGGCAAMGTAVLAVGATLDLELDLEGRAPLKVRGRVLRSDSQGEGELRRFGIRFEDLQRSTERELQRHVLAAQRKEIYAGLPAAAAAC